MKIGWSEAIARLARERTSAEALVELLKKYGSQTNLDRGSFFYNDAKAEIDAVIGGLLVAMAQKSQPTALPDLEERLRAAMEHRKKLADLVQALVPDTSGQRAGIGDIISQTVEKLLSPLRDAVRALWNAHLEHDSFLRATIQTQLEGVRWRDFAAIQRRA
jgi:hypothetical protein